VESVFSRDDLCPALRDLPTSPIFASNRVFDAGDFSACGEAYVMHSFCPLAR
jgi:hypothetical protein